MLNESWDYLHYTLASNASPFLMSIYCSECSEGQYYHVGYAKKGQKEKEPK